MTSIAHQEPHDLAYYRGEATGRSTGELISGIASDASEMFRLELEAAKLDLREEVGKAKAALVVAALGGSVLAIGSFVLAFAAVWALALVLPLWASALIVGGALVLLGGIFLLATRSKVKQLEAPTQALQETKRDVKWIKEKSSV